MNVVEAGSALSDEKRLGQVVQEARRHAGLTQQALCQRSGLSYSTLAKIERGAIKAPSVFTIQHIATTLGISLDQLIRGAASPAAPPAPKKVSQSGVRFVYFDMNGCLVRAASRAFTLLAEDSGVAPDVIETVFWQYNDDLNRGTIDVAELNTALSERLDMTVDWPAYYLRAVEATPGVSELVAWVAENYFVGLLTNTMSGLVEAMMQRGTLPRIRYDAIVDSSVVHALKPESRIFEIAAEKAGFSPSEILLVDDDRSNLAAAGKLGWHAISFDAYHPEESIVAISTALQPAE